MFITCPNIEAIPDVCEKRKNIRVVIADDHPITRDALKKLLAREEDIEVVGEAGDGHEALDRVRELDPDVLLLDLRMPNLDGFSVLKAMHPSSGRLKVLVMTASEDKKEFVQAMRLGSSGIVLKQTPLALISKSIRKVHAGEIWLDSHTVSAVMAQFSSSPDIGPAEQSKGRGRSVLSHREQEVTGLVSRGYKNKDIAEKLFVSKQTVKNHLHNIFGKLGISDRLDLALYAIHDGLNARFLL